MIVYLAESTSDLSAEHGQIRRVLQQLGHAVLPIGSLPAAGSELRQRVAEDLAKAILSIHLLGPNYGTLPEGESESSTAIQATLAIQRCDLDPDFGRLIWLLPDSPGEEERQADLIARLRNIPAGHRQVEILSTSLETLQQEIEAKLETSGKVPATAAGELRNPDGDATETRPGDNPFPGLRPFAEDQAQYFFGRETHREEMLSRLIQRRFVAVVGSSGSGKSSLVRAGLLPRLRAGFRGAAGATWRIALLRPGGEPIVNLANALNCSGIFGESSQQSTSTSGITPAEFTEVTLRRGPLGLIDLARLADPDAKQNLLVMVDQFEEIFRFDKHLRNIVRDDSTALIRLLLAAVKQNKVPIYVVLTLRSDYIGECSRYPELAAAISDSQFLVPRLLRHQLKAVITGPAAVNGAEITPRLLQKLMGDVGDDADHLPLIQHALMRTWESWDAAGRTGPIDLPHYERTGGVREALSRHVDEAFFELDGSGQRIAELLFRCLTEISEQRSRRRPTTLEEAAAVADVPVAEVILVVEVFRKSGRQFLMPSEGFPLMPWTVLDISHESLMRVSDRLRFWLENEAAAARRYRRLAETAQLYEAGMAGLLRNPELSDIAAWWRRERLTSAWAARYGFDFAATARYLEFSRIRARESNVLFILVWILLSFAFVAFMIWRS